MPTDKAMPDTGRAGKMRLDKWLWAARFFKTRSLAATAIASHKIKCNGEHVKPARDLKAGDELEITVGQTVFVVIVQGMADQRRPAPEARRDVMKFVTARRRLRT